MSFDRIVSFNFSDDPGKMLNESRMISASSDQFASSKRPLSSGYYVNKASMLRTNKMRPESATVPNIPSGLNNFTNRPINVVGNKKTVKRVKKKSKKR